MPVLQQEQEPEQAHYTHLTSINTPARLRIPTNPSPLLPGITALALEPGLRMLLQAITLPQATITAVMLRLVPAR
jgi:hypothetical protein